MRIRALLFAVLIACGSDSPASNVVVQLAATGAPTPDGSVEVQATVLRDGRPAANEPVAWSAAGAAVDLEAATTDASGQMVARVWSARLTGFTVVARSGGAEAALPLSLASPAWYRADEGIDGGSGRISSDLRGSSTAYALAGSGRSIYRTDDAGLSWVEVTSAAISWFGAGLPAVSNDDPRVVYAPWRSGVFVSRDGGASWLLSRVWDADYARGCTSAAAGPPQSGVVYAQCSTSEGSLNAIWVSGDAGATWSKAWTFAEQSADLQFAAAGADASTLYAPGGDGLGIAKSSDRGATWQTVTSPPATEPLVAIVADGQDPLLVYAVVMFGRAFRSEDGGGTWSEVANPPSPGGSGGALWVDRARRGVLYRQLYWGPTGSEPVARHELFRSADAGRTWARVETGGQVTDVASAPGGGVFASLPGGLSWSADGATGWEPRQHGLHELRPRELAIDELHPAVLYASTGDRLFRSSDGAATWTRAHAEPQLPVSLSMIAVDASRAGRLFAVGEGAVLRSDDAGATWAPSVTGISGTVVDLALAPDGDAYVLTRSVAGYGSTLFRSADGGRTWAQVLATSAAPSRVDAVDGAVGVLAMGSTGITVFTSEDRGTTWAEHPLARPPSVSTVWSSRLALDRSDPATRYVGFEEGVPLSTKPYSGPFAHVYRLDGSTWTAAGSLFASATEASLAVLEAGPAGTSIVYVAGQTCPGDYCARPYFKRSDDRGASWVDVPLPGGAAVSDLAIDPGAPSTLYAATSAGLFKTTTGGR